MRKYLSLFFIFVAGLFILTACNTPTTVSDLNDSSSEVESSTPESTTTPSNSDTNTSTANENSNTESTTDEEESKDKIKNDGELNDGIEWGPLED